MRIRMETLQLRQPEGYIFQHARPRTGLRSSGSMSWFEPVHHLGSESPEFWS